MEFLSLSRRRSSVRNVPSGEERGETDVFAGYRSTQREILRKRPKNNNKAWIKLSEAILSVLGDCWEKFISSSLPARLMEDFPASKVHPKPATWLTGKFPSRRMSKHYRPVLVWSQGKIQTFSEGGRGLGSVGKWVWPIKGEIHRFSGKGGEQFSDWFIGLKIK